MGTIKPEMKPPKAEPPKSSSATPWLHLGVFALLATTLLFLVVNFHEEEGIPSLSPEENARLEQRLQEIDEAEQYALIANEDGWYPCNHPRRASFYLSAGEIWKYGTTTKGQAGRYSIKFLEKAN